MKLFSLRDPYLLLVTLLVQMTAWLPSTRLRRGVIACVTSAAYVSSRRKRARVREALSIAFGPELDPASKRAIVRAGFLGFWKEVFVHPLSEIQLDRMGPSEIRGLEHLHRLRERDKGAILWESSAFGCRIAAKRLLSSHGYPVHQVHAAGHVAGLDAGRRMSWIASRVIQPYFDACESKYLAGLIVLSGTGSLAFTRELARKLDEKALVCISSDGEVSSRRLEREFLGFRVSFPTGVVGLAKLSGAPILPIFCVEDEAGSTVLTIEDPIYVDPREDRNRAVDTVITRYSSLFESYVRRHPDQCRYWSLVSPRARA